MAQCEVSVVLTTYNRSDLLGPAIERLLEQSTTPAAYEVVIVDNNSTDNTRGVVEQYIPASGGRLRYVFEPQQGIAFGRNAGIATARADIVAFTDDDVRVADGWVQLIKATFEARSDVDAVGGRILPIWPVPPPAWLTSRHWVGALALQDYGDTPAVVVGAATARSLAGANFAFRKRVFDDIGLFTSELGACAEDTEFVLRFWRAGRLALYVPDMVVHAQVQAERLTKAYHRRWHVRCGSFARLAEELSGPRGSGRSAVDFARILGFPRFAVRELASETVSWLWEAVRRREADAFWHEGQMRELVVYMRESRARHRRSKSVRRPSSRDPGARTATTTGCSQERGPS